MKGLLRKTLMVVALLIALLVSSPKPKYQEENPWLAKNGRPLVMAHAGGKGLYPEDTMTAFEYAYGVGVDVLEMDVMMTEDRILVLRHGENNTGNIRLMSNCDTVIHKAQVIRFAGAPSLFFVDHEEHEGHEVCKTNCILLHSS